MAIEQFTKGIEPEDPNAAIWRFMELWKFRDLLEGVLRPEPLRHHRYSRAQSRPRIDCSTPAHSISTVGIWTAGDRMGEERAQRGRGVRKIWASTCSSVRIQVAVASVMRC